jgi:large subunit ribosomal protein L23
MILRPISTEKAVMMIERDNLLTFSTDLNSNKEEIKKEIEQLFEVKLDSIRTLRKNNKKYIYAKLNKKYPAIDVASKLGLM